MNNNFQVIIYQLVLMLDCNITIFIHFVEDGVKDLPIIPVDTTVIAGQDVRLNCSSAYYKNVWWTRYQVGSTILEPIYYGYSGLVNGYKAGGRHSVDADDAAGHYNLFIRNVQHSDAGKYQCIDQSGLGTTVHAELIVLGEIVTTVALNRFEHTRLFSKLLQ